MVNPVPRGTVSSVTNQTAPEVTVNTTPRTATDPQRKLIGDLLRELREGGDNTDFAKSTFEQLKAKDAAGELTFDLAKSTIENLLALRKEQKVSARATSTKEPKQRLEVPEGRYAVKNQDDDWAFFRVTERGAVWVFRSDDERPLAYVVANTVKKKILELGLDESSKMFGVHSTFCYACGHRLTDKISMSLGIGPVCRSTK